VKFGELYLAVVLDLLSRRAIRQDIGNCVKKDLASRAMNMP